MNSSFLHRSHNASFNSTLNSTFNSSTFSRRQRAGDATVFMSTDCTQFLEPYGPALPAMVKVALSAATPTTTTARLDPNGWGWLVSSVGRKVYVWKHSDGAQGSSKGIGGSTKGSAISCRELPLPPSELLHTAKLVLVLASTPPSLLAITPEGHITYWPNIGNESTTVSMSADIPGQECDSVTSLWPLGAIVTTTSGTVLLVRVVGGAGGRGKPTLSCFPLLVQKGWLGGWSKKVSTMLFAPMPHAPSGLDNKRARVVVGGLGKDYDPALPGNNKNVKLYIFHGPLLQLWQFTRDGTNTPLCSGEINIDDSLRREFFHNVWATEGSGSGNKADVRGIQCWVLDVATVGKEIAVFAAAKSQYESSENLVYGIVSFNVDNYRSNDEWSFLPLSCGVGAGATSVEEEHFYSWKLLATQTHFFVVSSDSVLCGGKTEAGTVSDSIDSSVVGGPIVGCGHVTWNSVVILVPKWGLLNIKPAPLQQDGIGLDETFTELRIPDHLAMSMTASNLVELTASDSSIDKYKSAFLLYMKKRVEEGRGVLDELFPPFAPSSAPQDPLDVITIKFAEQLIDEPPVSDPRWGTTFRKGEEQDPMGLKSKILIKNFLVNKKEGLELFFGFLQTSGISGRLKGVVMRDELVSTNSLLYNAYEKVWFTLSLQGMQCEAPYRKAIDTAIKSIVTMRKEQDMTTRSSALSPNDLFYKEVSKVHQVIPALVSILEEDLQSVQGELALAPRILLTNEILLRAFGEVGTAGLSDKLGQVYDFLVKPLLGAESEDAKCGSEYQVVPWITQPGVHSALLKQHCITVEFGLQGNPELELALRVELLKQLEQLTELILESGRTNVLSIHSVRYPSKLEEFRSLCSSLLRAHLSVSDYEGAATLAEKFQDFEILSNIFYDQKNFVGMEQYFGKYEGYPEFAFEWFVRQGKGGELVEIFSRSAYGERLGRFLETKPYPHISWHHSAVRDEFRGAASTLKTIAKGEEGDLHQKKFLLCMAKLGAIATGEEPFAADVGRDVDEAMRLLEYQSRLPQEILSIFGMGGERDKKKKGKGEKNNRVLSPSEMIDMYSTRDVPFNPANYTAALAVAEFIVNEELRMEKRMLIASRVIERDPWEEWGTVDNPMDVVADSALYAYLVAAVEAGWSLEEAYPLPQLFGFSELRGLMSNPSVKFLLRAAHEHISTSPEMEHHS